MTNKGGRPARPYYLKKIAQAQEGRKLTARRVKLAEIAWAYAQPIIDRFALKDPRPDYHGGVAERIVAAVPRFMPDNQGDQAGQFRRWISRHIYGACLDARRKNVLVGRSYHGQRATMKVVQFSEPDGDGSWTPDILTVHDPVPNFEMEDRFDDICRNLSTYQQGILRDHYLRGMSFSEIAAERDVSKQAIWQMHCRTLEELRKQIRSRISA
jgi:RNA polymerase sigma factor (sigma-70 family)